MASLRKVVHIAGALFVPIALYHPFLAVGLSLLGIVVFFLADAVKSRLDARMIRLFYREGEMSGTALEPLAYLTSIAILLTLSLIYMPMACYVAIIVLTLGDGISSFAGKTIGGPHLPFSEKTWSGMLGGFLVCAIAGFLVAGPWAIVGAAGGMIAEAYSGRADNLLTAAAAFLCMVLISLV
ncbi:MAG TPA: hypothetical protein VK436_01445 [Methanocella sp.]|nr:hypothetical protein [Methanocella sp.]